MPDPTTVNLGLAVPTRGTDVGTWDVPLNGDMNIIDSKFGVVSTIALSNAPVTLNATQYQSSILRFTGILTANVTITLPAVSLMYACENLCTGPWTVILTCGGQVIALPPGECVNVFTDGTNVKFKDLGRVGSYLDYAGSDLPGWAATCTIPPYLKCDGSTYSSVTYPALFTILGTTTLPDFRGRNRSYLDDSTGRITTAGSGIDGATRFSGGGSQNVTLTQTNLPSGVSLPYNLNSTFNIISNNAIARAPSNLDGQNNVTVAGSDTFYTANAFHALSVNVVFTGGISLGGSSTPSFNMPPTAIGGITMIRAA